MVFWNTASNSEGIVNIYMLPYSASDEVNLELRPVKAFSLQVCQHYGKV